MICLSFFTDFLQNEKNKVGVDKTHKLPTKSYIFETDVHEQIKVLRTLTYVYPSLSHKSHFH